MSDDLFRIASKLAGVRTAGLIEFKKDQGPIRRNIRVQNFRWDPDRFRELSKILWAVERGHGYIIAALRLFSRMPSADFSPDGLLGGIGYIQDIRTMRGSLAQATELLSTFSDTLHDEVNAAHWSQVSSDPGAQTLLDETAEVKADPEAFVQSEYDDAKDEGAEGYDDGIYQNPSAQVMNPRVEIPEPPDDESSWDFYSEPITSSKLPELEEKEASHSELPKDDTAQKRGLSGVEMLMNTTGENSSNYTAAIKRIPQQILERLSHRLASASLPTETESDPRVDHIGPAEGGEAGNYNGVDGLPSDDLLGEGFNSRDYIYEGDAANGDGVTGYDNPTKGDETTLRSSLSSYSWLPGSRNEKLYNYYDPNLTIDEINWMRANDAPDDPMLRSQSRKVMTVDPLYQGYY